MPRALLDQPSCFVLPASMRAADAVAFHVNISMLLPFGRSQSYRAAASSSAAEAALPEALLDALRETAGGTLAERMSIALSALLLILARSSGQSQAWISPVSEVAGPALPLTLRGDQLFSELRQHVAELLHTRASAQAGDEAAQVVPNVAFAYVLEGDDGEAAVVQTPGDGEALRLTIYESTSATRLQWSYDPQLLAPAHVGRFNDALLSLLEAIATRRDATLAELPLMGAAERERVLNEWNATARPFPAETSVHELVEANAAQRPDAPAVIYEAESLSYRELNARANQLAHLLRQAGVGPETRVGICLDRSVAMVVSVLAVLKAGGAYLPLDPSYPAERLRFMIEDAGLSALLTAGQTETSALAAALAGSSAAPRVIALDNWSALAGQPQRNLPKTGSGESLAYVIYTSGSTGTPKGVLLQHRGLTNFILGQIEAFGITAASRVLQFASFSFDASVSEIFTTLVAGAALVLARREVLLSPTELRALLRGQAITTATIPPSLLAILPSDDLPDLQTVVSAGEGCSWELATRWAAGRRFLNAYGPTEATVGPTCYAVTERIAEAGSVPIGRPLPNYQAYILDQWMQPVPIGTQGELYIGGVSLARGYHNRPELTAERFVYWSPTSGAADAATPGAVRLYRTGDLARHLPDGVLEFLGRADQQVKLRGFRIEPGEIEAVLRQHPGVLDAAIVADASAAGATLSAYVVPCEQERIELWPSVAEFFVYDDLLYHAMTHDERRNASYLAALRREVAGKVVLDIGTGKDAILSRLAVEAGARKVYAIELIEQTYHQARATVQRLGLADRIEVIHGDARTVTLPEPIDVCVSEIVGSIGGSEGARQIINDAWRFMKPDGLMIPERSITRIAAVSLPDTLFARPAFTPVSAHYVERIFADRGHRFDLRLCLRGVRSEHLVSNIGVLEDLDFTRPVDAEYQRTEVLTISRAGRIDGFLAWLNLYTVPDELIDILCNEHCWLPVFFPAFSPGIDVAAGDRIELSIHSRPCENDLNPDYFITGRLVRSAGETLEFAYVSHHEERAYRASPFYQRLFAGNRVPVVEPQTPALDPAELRDFLGQQLPDYMVPSQIIELAALPTTPNGKVDRAALPRPQARIAADAQPRTDDERRLAEIWSAVLGRPIGIYDDFFSCGGHSLRAAQVIAQVNAAFDTTVPLRLLFEAPTIASFASAMKAVQSVGAAQLDLRAEVVLDPSIVPPPMRAVDVARGAILITGATGFLGAHLLAELLSRTDDMIYCLVRASDAVDGARRVRQSLKRYALWNDRWRARLIAVPGTLSEARLALSDAQYAKLAGAVDRIYHAGAQVHYLHSYEMLRQTNVGGTVEILRFACDTRLKEVHYISTLAVPGSVGGRRVCREQDELAGCESPMGYVQSKWVAEALLRLARGRGVPVTIYRPGRINSHSEFAVVNEEDFFVHLLAGCMYLGQAPNIPLVENLIPVDYAARAIVHLSFGRHADGQTYHLLNPQPTPWQWVLEMIEQFGQPLTMAPYKEWHRALTDAAAAEQHRALHSLLLTLPSYWAPDSSMSGRDIRLAPTAPTPPWLEAGSAAPRSTSR